MKKGVVLFPLSLLDRASGWAAPGSHPVPPALPAPSLAGRRQLCGCSPHLPPPESPALKLPGCGQPCCHGNYILHPFHSLHLKAIRENRGTGETEDEEKTVAWLYNPSFSAHPYPLAASYTGSISCPGMPQTQTQPDPTPCCPGVPGLPC